MLTSTDALLIVDVQHDFLPDGALAVPGGDEVVPLLAACASAFAEAGLAVVASRDWHPANHCSFEPQGGQWPPHCVAGSAGAELHPGLDLPPGTIIVNKATTAEKDCYSAFEATDLDAELKARGIERIFIGGLATEYCVLNSAADALKNDYGVTLMTDAIRAIDPDDGERAISSLADQGAVIAESSEILHEQS